MTTCMLVVSQLGFCSAYILFIAENMSSIFQDSVGRGTIVAACLPIICLLVCVRNVAALAPFSLVADVANLAALAVVFSTDFGEFKRHEEVALGFPVHSDHAGALFGPLPFLFGIFVYCFEGIGMILPLEASMQNRSLFPHVLRLAMLVIVVLFVCFGFTGYCAFGARTDQVITMNLPSDAWATHAVKSGLSLGLLLTYPMMMQPVFLTFETSSDVSPLRRNLVRCLISTATALLGMSIPGFSTFVSLIGSVACTALAFIMPITLHFIVCGQDLTLLQIILEAAAATIGVIGGACGAIDAVAKAASHFR